MRNEATNGGCQIDLKGQEKFAKGIQDTLQKGHKEPKVTVISWLQTNWIQNSVLS